MSDARVGWTSGQSYEVESRGPVVVVVILGGVVEEVFDSDGEAEDGNNDVLMGCSDVWTRGKFYPPASLFIWRLRRT